MPKKVVHARVGADRLRVENTWFSGAQLFLNDEVIATNHQFFALNKSRPFMTAVAVVDGVKSRVDVMVWALVTVKIQIRVDGEIVAGEEI